MGPATGAQLRLFDLLALAAIMHGIGQSQKAGIAIENRRRFVCGYRCIVADLVTKLRLMFLGGDFPQTGKPGRSEFDRSADFFILGAIGEDLQAIRSSRNLRQLAALIGVRGREQCLSGRRNSEERHGQGQPRDLDGPMPRGCDEGNRRSDRDRNRPVGDNHQPDTAESAGPGADKARERRDRLNHGRHKRDHRVPQPKTRPRSCEQDAESNKNDREIGGQSAEVKIKSSNTSRIPRRSLMIRAPETNEATIANRTTDNFLMFACWSVVHYRELRACLGHPVLAL
jgi:hypothetical protein